MTKRMANAIDRTIALDGEQAARYIGAGAFLVVSASDPAKGAYRVDLDAVDGTPVTRCTCRAGELGFPCWHQATALLMAGIVDVPTEVGQAA